MWCHTCAAFALHLFCVRSHLTLFGEMKEACRVQRKITVHNYYKQGKMADHVAVVPEQG